MVRVLGPRLVGAMAICIAWPVQATYSIVGSDRATGETGGAGASCLSGSDVSIIYRAVPGVGTVHAQASLNPQGRELAVLLLAEGRSPQDIVASITAAEFDSSSALRQYAVVNVAGQIAAFTGERARAHASHLDGQLGSFRYGVQGNILTSRAVLTQAAAAFEASGCDLAERLLLALEAGAQNAEGDNRCTDARGIPSDSAFLQVERSETAVGSYLALRVPSSGSENPLVSLRAQFQSWRSLNPCPGSTPSIGSAGNASVQPGDAAQTGCSCGMPRPIREGDLLLGPTLLGIVWLARRRKRFSDS